MDEQNRPDGSFHINIDLLENGKTANLLVLPCNETFIIVKENEHLCTIVKTFVDPDYWELQNGSLNKHTVEKMGAAISGHDA